MKKSSRKAKALWGTITVVGMFGSLALFITLCPEIAKFVLFVLTITAVIAASVWFIYALIYTIIDDDDDDDTPSEMGPLG